MNDVSNLFEKLFTMYKGIYDSYDINNISKLKELNKLEEQEYDKLDFDSLNDLYNFVYGISYVSMDYDLDNYEILLYTDKFGFIIRRMINKLAKKMDEINIENFDNVNEVYDIAMNELKDKIITIIEVKFLYFLSLNDIVDKNKMEMYIKIMSFIDLDFEEKIINCGKDLYKLVENEDQLYNNLWNLDFIKNDYTNYLHSYTKEAITKDIAIMYSNRDLNNSYNTKVREIYLRTLFNYLDENTLSDINYKLYEDEFDSYNLEGQEAVKRAFRAISKDKELIKKIKTQ